MTMQKDKPLRQHLSEAGSKKSDRKAKSSRANGKINNRPHIVKAQAFVAGYLYQLKNNKDKFPTGRKTPTGRVETYNPDFFCPVTGFYIEIATSLPNVSICSPKWKLMLETGMNLKVYWWEGEEITEHILKNLSVFAVCHNDYKTNSATEVVFVPQHGNK